MKKKLKNSQKLIIVMAACIVLIAIIVLTAVFIKDYKLEQMLAEHYDYERNGDSVEINGIKDKTIKEFTVHDYVTIIGENAFSGCSELESVRISSSVVMIKEGAFKDCINLKSVIFEEGIQITEIGKGAFQNCISLKEFNIPDSVIRVGENAFNGCVSLELIGVGKSFTYGVEELLIADEIDISPLNGNYKVVENAQSGKKELWNSSESIKYKEWDIAPETSGATKPPTSQAQRLAAFAPQSFEMNEGESAYFVCGLDFPNACDWSADLRITVKADENLLLRVGGKTHRGKDGIFDIKYNHKYNDEPLELEIFGCDTDGLAVEIKLELSTELGDIKVPANGIYLMACEYEGGTKNVRLTQEACTFEAIMEEYDNSFRRYEDSTYNSLFPKGGSMQMEKGIKYIFIRNSSDVEVSTDLIVSELQELSVGSNENIKIETGVLYYFKFNSAGSEIYKLAYDYEGSTLITVDNGEKVYHRVFSGTQKEIEVIGWEEGEHYFIFYAQGESEAQEIDLVISESEAPFEWKVNGEKALGVIYLEQGKEYELELSYTLDGTEYKAESFTFYGEEGACSLEGNVLTICVNEEAVNKQVRVYGEIVPGPYGTIYAYALPIIIVE